MEAWATPRPRTDRRGRGRCPCPCGRNDVCGRTGGVAATARQYFRTLLRSGSSPCDASSRRPSGPGLHFLSGRSVVHALLHFTAGRIHPTPHLQRVKQGQAGVPDRSPATTGPDSWTQSGSADRSASAASTRAMTANLVIDVRDLSKRYGTRKVVEGLTLAV